MTTYQLKMFSMARGVSKLSTFHHQHVGSVVVSGHKVISTGCNSMKTNPLQHKYNKYRGFDDYESSIACQHAEVSALSCLIGKYGVDWENLDIYVYREKKDGSLGCSRPCKACSRLIKDLGIRRVYFIDENGNYTEERNL